MRTKHTIWRIGWAVVACCLLGAVAQAQSGNGNPNDTGNGGNGNNYGWGTGAPAAPEPATIAMISLGVLVVGSYVFYRLRRRASAAKQPGA